MDRSDLHFSGWLLVVLAAATMGLAGIYQFGWSSIRIPLGGRLSISETALGVIFTTFVVFQTLSQFPAGWIRDRYGPRVPLSVAAVCLTGGFGGFAFAATLPTAYVAAAVGGIGVGIAYTVAVNTPVKWFHERRGLATGIVTMAYSGVSVLAIPFIRGGVTDAFERTLLALAAVTGLATLAAVVWLRDPGTATDDSADDVLDEERARTWRESVRTWQFWLLYGVFILVNGVGLMIIGKVVSFASQLSLPVLAGTLSASFVALADSAGVFVGGTVSDRLGQRTTVAGSLVLSGIALAGAVLAGNVDSLVGFVALISAAAFFRSPVFAVFPAIVGDFYGQAYSSENYAALYTGKLFGGVFGGTVASGLALTIGWSELFLVGGGLLVLSGLSMTFLRPVGGS